MHVDLSCDGDILRTKELIDMKVFALAVLSLSIPSVCSAHSGALLNTVANYLPLLAPVAAGGVAGVIKFIRDFFQVQKTQMKLLREVALTNQPL